MGPLWGHSQTLQLGHRSSSLTKLISPLEILLSIFTFSRISVLLHVSICVVRVEDLQLSALASRYCLHFLKRKEQEVPQNCSFEKIFEEKSAEKQLCRLLEREADRESWRWLVFLKIDENFNLNGWNKTVVACL